jgi:hypothetical protein
MICPDCGGEDEGCLRCNGSGTVCDVCGEATEAGLDLCKWCEGLPPEEPPTSLVFD